MKSQIVLVGVGGQGILTATRLLAEAAFQRGLSVIGSETHGMSQRGGSVTSHVKIGGYASPLVAVASADIMIALEAGEAYRHLRFLRPARAGRPGGMLFVNAGASFPVSQVRELLTGSGIALFVIDATRRAQGLGAALVSNLITLGFASADGGFPFSLEELTEVVKRKSPARFKELNVRALEEGWKGRSAGE